MNREGIENMNEYAPITIPTLNRVAHLQKLINSLLTNKEAQYTELVIGLDYPPSEKYMEGFLKMKEYLPTIKGFKKVTILETAVHLGPNRNGTRLVDYVESQGYSSYIGTEDDNIFAPSFLSYMNWALRTFRDDSSVLAVCSYREIDDPIYNYKNNFYKAKWARPYGVAMWLDRYRRLQKRRDYDFMKELVNQMPLSIIFDVKKVSIASQYLFFCKKKVSYGDFCMARMCEDENMYCITPIKSLTKNIGSDGSGIHGSNLERQEIELARKLDDSKEFVPEWIEEDLNTYDVIVSENEIDKAQKGFDEKKLLRNAFSVVKFLLFKLTGIIISYKQN